MTRKVSSKRSPVQAEAAPRVALLKTASVQLRSRFFGAPAVLIERSSKEVDPARRRDPLSMAWLGDPSGGGAGGGSGGGGAGDGGVGSGIETER